MTCTIGYVDGNVVIMGCDSAATDQESGLKIRKNCCKIWKVKNFMVGFCGNYNALVWLKHVFQWPHKSRKETWEHWLLQKVFPVIRLKIVPEDSWTLMFGFASPGRILVLSEIGDIEETVDNFAVIGSAERFALGVLKTLENDNMFTWEKIQKALEIAEKFDCSVKGPMHLDILINP